MQHKALLFDPRALPALLMTDLSFWTVQHLRQSSIVSLHMLH
jgi:hypothetical protein